MTREVRETGGPPDASGHFHTEIHKRVVCAVSVFAAVLLAGCGPSDGDVSTAVTNYTKVQYSQTLDQAAALGGASVRDFAKNMLGIPDPETLPDFVCQKDKIKKQPDGGYAGVIDCHNPKLNGGKTAYAKVTLDRVNGTWTVTDYHALD